jgi:hypothetical protein
VDAEETAGSVDGGPSDYDMDDDEDDEDDDDSEGEWETEDEDDEDGEQEIVDITLPGTWLPLFLVSFTYTRSMY